jgi:hypothetical protein
MSNWKLQCHFCNDTVSTGQIPELFLEGGGGGVVIKFEEKEKKIRRKYYVRWKYEQT